MENIIKFCENNNLILIAIESLQNSIFNTEKKVLSGIRIQDSLGNLVRKENKFKSFRYLVNKMNSQLELFSIYSISQGPFYK